MTRNEIAGYVASILVFSTFYMKTMIPLRCVAMASNVAFIVYGLFGRLHPVLYLHCVLLPLNAVRLLQMRKLIADIKEASTGDLSLDSLAPMMKKERFPAGTVLFRKGDAADKLYLLRGGTLELPELGTTMSERGSLLGEIGIFTQTGQRTASAVCQTDVEALTLDADRVRQLYYQNPKFGLYLLRLIVRRLSSDENAAMAR